MSEFSHEEIEDVIKMVLCAMSVEKSRSIVVANGMRLVLSGQAELSEVILSGNLSEEEVGPHVDAAKKILVCNKNCAAQKTLNKKPNNVVEQALDYDSKKNKNTLISGKKKETQVLSKEKVKSTEAGAGNNDRIQVTSNFASQHCKESEEPGINRQENVAKIVHGEMNDEVYILPSIRESGDVQPKNNKQEHKNLKEDNFVDVITAPTCAECSYQKDFIRNLELSLVNANKEIEKLRNLTPKQFFEMRKISINSENLLEENIMGVGAASGDDGSASSLHHTKLGQNKSSEVAKVTVTPLLPFRRSATKSAIFTSPDSCHDQGEKLIPLSSRIKPMNSNLLYVNSMPPVRDMGRSDPNSLSESLSFSSNKHRNKSIALRGRTKPMNPNLIPFNGPGKNFGIYHPNRFTGSYENEEFNMDEV